MRKYVLLIIAVLAVIVGILGFFFSSPKYQIGDNIIEGKYLDTAYEAFVDSDGCPEYEFENDLATIDINNNFAIWIASTKTREFMLVKMSIKDGKYCSLDDFTIIKIKDCNTSKLERENTLGDKKLLQYSIVPSVDYKAMKNVKTENFIYKNKPFVFAYRIVDNNR